jgi:hypothetical protein
MMNYFFRLIIVLNITEFPRNIGPIWVQEYQIQLLFLLPTPSIRLILKHIHKIPNTLEETTTYLTCRLPVLPA